MSQFGARKSSLRHTMSPRSILVREQRFFFLGPRLTIGWQQTWNDEPGVLSQAGDLVAVDRTSCSSQEKIHRSIEASRR